MDWQEYPKNKPVESTKSSKKYYHVQVERAWLTGFAIKCWYINDTWLCDGFQTSISDAVSFIPAARNAKHELKLT